MSTATINIETEKQLVPELRFKEFEGEWQILKLREVAKIARGKFTPRPRNNPIYYNGVIPFVQTSDVVNANGKIEVYTQTLNEKGLAVSKLFSAGTILITIAANIGHVGVLQIDMACPDSLIGITPNDETHNYFLNYYLATHQKKMDYLAPEGAQKNINIDFLNPYKVPSTSLPEQQKIASFLSAVDEKIQQLTKKKALLEQYKKGVMQQLFSGQLRFKPAHPAGGDENLPAGRHGGNPYPDWEDAVMQDVFERVKEKNKENNLNVMSISAQQGLVNQLEYFNRYVSAADVTGYYLLKKGDFAYNKSYSKGYPMGAIKRLDFYDKGVVSTLYICFRIKENDDSTFYKEFLDHGGINSELHKIAQEGARNHGLLNMSVIEFFRDIKIPRPSAEEQIVIGKFLKDLSAKIEAVNNQITQTQTFKKGLLQQMFV